MMTFSPNQKHFSPSGCFFDCFIKVQSKNPWNLSSKKFFSTVEPRFTGPRFAGEPRFAGQEPADQTFHYISLLQKPRFTGQKTPILGIFSQKSGKMSWFFNIKFVLQMEK